MNNFNDWNDVLAMKGLREAVITYAKREAREYLEEGPDGAIGMNDDDYAYLLEQAIKSEGECVFYLEHGNESQQLDHSHYFFAGKYFECDGNGQISGPCDSNDAENIIDLASDAVRDSFGGVYFKSVGGDFPDDFLLKLSTNLIEVGNQIEINGTAYVRTAEGLVPKALET